jgi:hypothetical protein
MTKSSVLLQGFSHHQPLFQHPARSIQPAAINGIEPELMIADISGGCMNIWSGLFAGFDLTSDSVLDVAIFIRTGDDCMCFQRVPKAFLGQNPTPRCTSGFAGGQVDALFLLRGCAGRRPYHHHFI